MSVSQGRLLLKEAGAEKRRLRRHLLVAAALRELLSKEPVVVGGTAEEFWTADEYHETDLDLCVALSREDEKSIRDAGFSKKGRHWVHGRSSVAVEFPSSTVDGEPSRFRREPVGEGVATLIGLDDLYLDRLKQATVADTTPDIHFHSALAIAGARYEEIDWDYIRARIRSIASNDQLVGDLMRRQNRRIRSRVRRILTKP